MGGGCSRLVVSPQSAERGETNQTKKTGGPNNTLNSNVSAIAGNSKSPALQPLSRVVSFAVTRGNPTGIDAGSKSSSTVMRSNSFWLHEDDDRVDDVINRWKAAEILFLKVQHVLILNMFQTRYHSSWHGLLFYPLQGLFNEYLQTQKRSHPPPPTKGRSQQIPSAAESLRVPVEVLLPALTSKRMFIAASR